MLSTLEPATPDMSPVASSLIHLTMGRLAGYLFGSDAQDAQSLLGRLFRAESNRFSHQFSEVATQSGEVVGLVVTYSGRKLKALGLPTASHLLRACGVAAFIRFLSRALPLATVKEAADDEYFISHIAVLPAYQGQGLGTHLLSEVERMARERGFGKISLTVDRENLRALALYRRTGFAVTEAVSIKPLQRRIGFNGFYRMVRTLA